MAVFTVASAKTLTPWLLENYNIVLAGEPSPITEGIENTNYMIQAQDGSKYVFTVIEVWDMEMASYCLSLASHLHCAGQAVARVMPNVSGNGTCTSFEGKPAAVVEFVNGTAKREPTPADCATIGGHLARIHNSVSDFQPVVPNKRGYNWREQTFSKIKKTLDGPDASLLDEAIATDRQTQAMDLAEGACHCDLFRNNVLWSKEDAAVIIDFYFAGHDRFTFDIAVTAVDWSMDDLGSLDRDNLFSLLGGYLEHRKFSETEHKAFPDMMAVAALRFWLSRIDDVQNPRPAHQLVAHDPSAFRHRLSSCIKERDVIRETLEAASR